MGLDFGGRKGGHYPGPIFAGHKRFSFFPPPGAKGEKGHRGKGGGERRRLNTAGGIPRGQGVLSGGVFRGKRGGRGLAVWVRPRRGKGKKKGGWLIPKKGGMVFLRGFTGFRGLFFWGRGGGGGGGGLCFLGGGGGGGDRGKRAYFRWGKKKKKKKGGGQRFPGRGTGPPGARGGFSFQRGNIGGAGWNEQGARGGPGRGGAFAGTKS